MKTISILIPTFNEEDNILFLYNDIIKNIENLPYNYEIIFIDNYSTDSTRSIIRDLCKRNNKVKAIFNSRNFGPLKSFYYGLLQTTGDCTILIFADLQDPPNIIPKFIKEWENGYKVVVGKKVKSKEGIISIFRSLYYKIMITLSKIDRFYHIDNFNGFGLYDKEFIKILKSIEDSEPYFKNIIAQYAFKVKEVDYIHQKRKTGKTHISLYHAYDVAIISIINYSKVILRIPIVLGFLSSIITFIMGINTIINKLLNWDSYSLGIASILVGGFFIGSILLFFIGILGEYVININSKIGMRPLVIEEERINFDEDKN